jgi:hypothetical protein
MLEPRTPRLALAALVCALLAGCSHTELIGRGRTLYLALTEYRITPQDVRVSAGPLTVLVHNYGRLAHNLVIAHDGQPDAVTPALLPGQTAALTVTLAPGTYQMTSTILSDQTLGEYGTLTIDR